MFAQDVDQRKERRALMLEDERHERGMLRRMAGMEAAMEAAEALAAEQDDEPGGGYGADGQGTSPIGRPT